MRGDTPAAAGGGAAGMDERARSGRRRVPRGILQKLHIGGEKMEISEEVARRIYSARSCRNAPRGHFPAYYLMRLEHPAVLECAER